jgi:hypothetical protein
MDDAYSLLFENLGKTLCEDPCIMRHPKLIIMYFAGQLLAPPPPPSTTRRKKERRRKENNQKCQA